MTESGTMMIRAKITSDEWWQIRRACFDEGIPASVFVARALRKALEAQAVKVVNTKEA